jgi:hypothetical protein
MATQSRRLTIEFLEDKPYALRKVTQSLWPIECLISSRKALSPGSGTACREALDAPGVYLLVARPERSDAHARNAGWRLYVGQADSVADRLHEHLKSDSKQWFETVIAIKRQDDHPLNLSQCHFLESKLFARAFQAGTCTLMNKNEPGAAKLSPADVSETTELMEQAIFIVTALGWDFFEPQEPVERPVPPVLPPPRPVPPNMQSLLEAVRNMVRGPSFPKAEWYSTQTPDYRAKVVSGEDFRVFARISVAKNWLSVEFRDRKNVEKLKIRDLAELEKHRQTFQAAYDRAEKYLHKGTA